MAKGDNDTVTMTRADFEAAIKAASANAAEATVAALQAVTKANEGPRPQEWRDLAKAPEVPLIPCKSPGTGATFNADVQRETVIRLVDYAYPPEAETHQDQGGAVPNGLDVKDVNGQYTIQYKQWRYENYWKADLALYVGKRFNKSIAVAAAA